MSARVYSEVQVAKDLCEGGFSMVIPSYQRPYVWPDEDVAKLLEDIIAACEADEPHYYIGTVLTAKTPLDASVTKWAYVLIDGQQRMTTLVIMALAFRQFVPDSELAALAVFGGKPRLTFAIREQVEALLGAWAGLEDYHAPVDEAIQSNPYLTSLAAAYKVATDRFKFTLREEGEGKLRKIGDFLFCRVKWVNNRLPEGMDLNRLFATMNTRGVQLEQTDILKSQLLRKISQNTTRYDSIWQACENLENYFERNLRRLFPNADWNNLAHDDLSLFSPAHFPLEEAGCDGFEGMTIAELASEDVVEVVLEQEEEREVYCRSIVSFGLLLIHAYRIFRQERGESDVVSRISDARLNECFSGFVADATEQDVTAFFEVLWQVRFQFDRWVVKWVQQAEDEDEHLRTASVHLSKSNKGYRLTRSPLETSNLSQLQSVRYFTGERSAQYWLTPFLGQLVQQRPTTPAQVEALLEGIDNQLSLTTSTQKDASFGLLGDKSALATEGIEGVCRVLREAHGTGFAHYWFQKVEYILWREQETLGFFDAEKIRRFRIASKTSVEHVHPQQEEYGRALEDAFLHCFGNLVLLNPRENSSYSNQTVRKKRADFMSKPRYDSLKLAHLFHTMGAGEWDKAAILRHQEALLTLLLSHYA